ncbi:MAG: thermonuclease family protein [Neisseriaceae bacterium]|nr:thermonuclease family protein [Neisseriaceae bacterium]
MRLTNERQDKYGRVVATVFSGSLNVNLAMIEQGYAGTMNAIQTTQNTPPQCNKHRLKSVGCGQIKAKLSNPKIGGIVNKSKKKAFRQPECFFSVLVRLCLDLLIYQLFLFQVIWVCSVRQ